METTMSHKPSIAFPMEKMTLNPGRLANPGLARKNEASTLAGWRVVVGEVRMPPQPIADAQENGNVSADLHAPPCPVPNEDREKHASSVRDRTRRISHSHHLRHQGD